MRKHDNFGEYHSAVRELESLIGKEKRDYMRSREKDKSFFLGRTQFLFDRLGNPERQFHFVHVTGTSGKGSTATMVHNILAHAGWNVGLYVSPHVTTSLERMSINAQFVAPADFAHAVHAVMPVVAKIRKKNPTMVPSYTDVVFAVAMLIFQQHHCKWVVLEVGCGGRFDHTNIIPPPAVTIITNISREHIGVLGETLEDIAWHKAGIIKHGAQLFSAETNPKIRAVLNFEAKKFDARIHYISASSKKSAKSVMVGKHQKSNSALAAAAGRGLGIAEQHIRSGIAATRLPARIEIMQKQPRVILDGAHAPAKMEALVATIHKKCTVIFAPKEGKEIDALIRPLVNITRRVIITSWQLPGFRSEQPTRVATQWKKIQPRAEKTIEPSPHAALRHALRTVRTSDTILITGSLYLAGCLRAHWIPEEKILTTRCAFPAQRI